VIRARANWRRLAPLILLGVVIVFWGRSLAANWTAFRTITWQVRWHWLAISALVLLVHQPLLAFAWQQILTHLDESLPVPQALRIYLLAQIARYIPGGVWDIAGRVYLAGEAGYARAKVSYSILLEMVLHVVSAALFFLLTLPFWPNIRSLHLFAVAMALMGVGGLVALHPALLSPAMSLLARLTKREVGSAWRIPFSSLLQLLGYQLLARLLIGTAFAAFTFGIYPLDITDLPLLAGVFVAGWLVGFLVVIMPMGIGVREGAIAWLLTNVMPLPAATAAAIGFRIWIALRDLAWASIAARLRTP